MQNIDPLKGEPASSGSLAGPTGLQGDPSIATSTLSRLLDDAAARWGWRTAIEYRGRRIDFTTLKDTADRLAAGLLRMGIGPGLKVALLLPNTPWHPACLFALARLGAHIVHLSPLDARRELVHKLADSGARVLITTDLVPSLLEAAAALKTAGTVDVVLTGRDTFWLEAASEKGGAGPSELSGMLETPPPCWPTVREDDIVLLQYTSGTTGAPKAALLTHANLTASVSMFRAWFADEQSRIGPISIIGVLPLSHIYALVSVLLIPLAEGNKVLLRPRFDLTELVHDIEAEPVTCFPGVPTMYVALLNLPGIASRNLSSLRICLSGGAPLPVEVEQRVVALIGQPLRSGWGMTETATAGTSVPMEVAAWPGLAGAPLPGVDIRIVGLEAPGRELGPGQVGEVAIKGPNVFVGYWNRPEATAEAFVDGFFLTGDVGRKDAAGLLTLVGRRKEIIISGGFNVYPAVVEQAIREHPDIAEVAVIGIPDPYRGQSAKAFVVLRPGAAILDLATLKTFLRDRLGPHEMPVGLSFRDVLPRGPTGKVIASALTEEEALQ